MVLIVVIYHQLFLSISLQLNCVKIVDRAHLVCYNIINKSNKGEIFMLGKEIMKIKILDNFEKTLIALDDCGYENDFSFEIVKG